MRNATNSLSDTQNFAYKRLEVAVNIIHCDITVNRHDLTLSSRS